MNDEKIHGPKDAHPNLQDLRDLPPEKRKEIASAGGKASVETKRLKGTFKEIVKTLLDCQAPAKALEKLHETFPELVDSKIDNRAAMILSQMLKAIKGDTSAFMVIRDTAGEKPIDKIKTQVTEDIDIDLDGEEYD